MNGILPPARWCKALGNIARLPGFAKEKIRMPAKAGQQLTLFSIVNGGDDT